MFDFHYQLGTARRKPFRVPGDVCTIGSARDNLLVVSSRNVGKRHAELRLRADGVHLKDLGSLSGCWVNRERVVDSGPLGEFDEIAVGDMLIILSDTARVAKEMPSVTRVSEDAAHEAAAKTREAGFEAGTGAGVRAESGANTGTEASTGTEAGTGTEASTSTSTGKRSRLRMFGFGGGKRDAGRGASEAPAEASSAPALCVVETPHRSPGSDAPTGESIEPPPDNVVSLPVAAEVPEETREADEQLAYWGGIVHEQLLYQMDLRRKDVNRMSDAELREESLTLIESIIASLESQLPDALDRPTLQINVLNESVGLGPLEQFLEDDEVTEIMVNNHQEIFVEKAGKLERSRFRFTSDRTVYSVIERIITPLGRRIDESSPIVDARLKDGSRVNAIIPPLALKGPSLTIRKFPKHRLQFSDLVNYGSVSQEMVDFLRVCVEMRKNVVVSGGTGSGKTTLLNVLSNFIPDTDRIVTIEDAAELKLVQPNLVSLESRPSNLEGKGAVPIRDLVKNSLRMRPDRIVVGECRGGEALDMLQAMNTGHDGSLTTVHANNPRDMISRLEVLVLMAGMDLPVTAIREQVASAVDIVLQQTRFHCGSRKVTKVTEVVGMESGTVQLQDIFTFEQQGVDENGRVRGSFKPTGAIPTFYEALRDIGYEVDLSVFQSATGFEA